MIGNTELLEKIIAEVVAEYLSRPGIGAGAGIEAKAGHEAGAGVAELPAPLADVGSSHNNKAELVYAPQDSAALQRMKKRTTARIGVGKAGARLTTQTLLTLRADHAAARDAVFRNVEQAALDALGFFTVESSCASRIEFLTRPDLGRQLTEPSKRTLIERCHHNPDVQVFAADGLSSTALTANLPNLFPSLMDGLQAKRLNVGTPFFVRNGRVGIMDQVSKLLGCKVTCVLIGERPGLASAESLSAYIAYDSRVDMPESNRTVVSNIHRKGIPAVEAGAYLAELLYNILAAKASGVAFREKEGLSS